MRYDLEQEVWRQKRCHDCITIGGFVLIAHAAGGDPHRAVVESADQCIDFIMQRRLRELFWKPPKLAATGDRRMIVKKHAMRVSTFAPVEAHRDDLAALGIVTEAGRI